MKIHAVLWNLSHTKVLSEMTLEETPWIHIPVFRPPRPAAEVSLRFREAAQIEPLVTIAFVPFGWTESLPQKRQQDFDAARGVARSVHFHPESIPSVEGCEEYL